MVYDNDTVPILKQIKKVMIDKDITQQVLSDRLGKSKQAVSNLFRQDNISLNTLNDLVNACDCDLIIDIVPKVK